MQYSEEKARATGAGRITEFLVQMYGNWKAAGKPLMKFEHGGTVPAPGQPGYYHYLEELGQALSLIHI